MDEDTSKSKVNDEDLDQMIASIKGQPATPPTITGQGAPLPDSAEPVIPPTPPEPTSPPMNSAFVPDDDDAAPQNIPVPAPEPEPVAVPTAPTPTATPSGLDDIKRSALSELRPLVDKLTLPPEEKFNTILLIIRSTDDASLLAAANEAARAIPDENHRAQALLDVIKEVDFFSTKAA